tara:strand:+ start:966 stop:1385 length:420 start_codon:yes stop_codon:yes gene_type:complete
MNWKCKYTWKRAINNTAWCLLGCSIGDFGTIFFFQSIEHAFTITAVMSLAILNGLITSIILETLILLKQMNFRRAINTALGMSFISMIGMELSMNFTDIILTGGAILTWWAVPIMLFIGFITPLPYNYYKLKKYNIGCH